jgi:hypothetical protein
MMRTTLAMALLGVLMLPVCAAAADLSARDWLTEGGEWSWRRELVPLLRQGAASGEALALCRSVNGSLGAWRSYVQPGAAVGEAGLLLLADEAGRGGLRLTLGAEGLTLRRADGRAVWADSGMPWYPYHTYCLEVVVERGRVRVQAFENDSHTLASQSPWLTMSVAATTRPSALGLYTRDGIARFRGFARTATPLSPIVADAPNKLRLQAGPNAPWAVVGPGSWNWTTTDRQRLRQRATVERSSAITREAKGALRQWECRVQVAPGAGGAGMLFQGDERAEQGLLAWLGGEHGNGTLMLYRMPLDALWGGPDGNWRYDTEYVLRAETRLNGEAGEARAQLLQADGQIVIQDTGWVNVGREAATREGYQGFMTWLGAAEFGGFGGALAESGVTAQTPAAGTEALGDSWVALGDGAWEWTDAARSRLRQTSAPARALALSTEMRGLMGVWRCRCRPGVGARAGLVFQADAAGREGFAALLTPDGMRLESLAGKTMWEDGKVRAEPGWDYVVTGEVMTDRVAMRCYAADGKTLLSECPAVYVPDTNNQRQGVLGVLCSGGQAEFWDWGYTP